MPTTQTSVALDEITECWFGIASSSTVSHSSDCSARNRYYSINTLKSWETVVWLVRFLMALYLYYTLFGIVSLCLLRFKVHRSLHNALPFPPGPLGLPFLGYVPLLWERKPWVQFEKWKEIYGMLYAIIVVRL